MIEFWMNLVPMVGVFLLGSAAVVTMFLLFMYYLGWLMDRMGLLP